MRDWPHYSDPGPGPIWIALAALAAGLLLGPAVQQLLVWLTS